MPYFSKFERFIIEEYFQDKFLVELQDFMLIHGEKYNFTLSSKGAITAFIHFRKNQATQIDKK